MNADGHRYERQRAAVGYQLSALSYGKVLIRVISVIRGSPCRYAVLRNEPSFVRRTANYGGQAPNGGYQLSAISYQPRKGRYSCHSCNQWSDVAVCRIAKRTLLRSPYGELRRAGPKRQLSAIGYQRSVTAKRLSVLSV